jgi:Domain of unknown function (DUF4159)
VAPRRLVIGLAVLLILAVPLIAAAQRGRLFGFGSRFGQYANVPYDGRFTFARIQYARYGGWAADYPAMERNLTTILQEITSLRPHVKGSNIHTFDDPELLKYPIAYLSEPGYWFPSEAEVLGLRDYLHKGGFLIADDFHFPNEWAVFEAAMRRVLPAARIERLDLSHPIFNTFFRIDSLKVPYPGRLGEQGLMGEFFGIHEDNDPRRRLTVVINYNIDIGDYVEWSGENLYNPMSTNEAYKFAVNYIIYGLTH